MSLSVLALSRLRLPRYSETPQVVSTAGGPWREEAVVSTSGEAQSHSLTPKCIPTKLPDMAAVSSPILEEQSQLSALKYTTTQLSMPVPMSMSADRVATHYLLLGFARSSATGQPPSPASQDQSQLARHPRRRHHRRRHCPRRRRHRHRRRRHRHRPRRPPPRPRLPHPPPRHQR